MRVYGACTSDRYNVCLIMELMEGGNLFQRIYDRKKRRMSYLEILQVRLAHARCRCGFGCLPPVQRPWRLTASIF